MAVICPKGHADVQALAEDQYQCVICGAVFSEPPKKKGKK